jgi:predicted DsbA family dithiol-disulfide isomerase
MVTTLRNTNLAYWTLIVNNKQVFEQLHNTETMKSRLYFSQTNQTYNINHPKPSTNRFNLNYEAPPRSRSIVSKDTQDWKEEKGQNTWPKQLRATYNTTIAYDVIPIIRRKQSLEDYYAKIWNALYVNSANASQIKLFIPTIFHRLSLSLWPNFFSLSS